MSLKVIKKYGNIHQLSQPTKLRKFGVPPSGPIDPFTPELVRAALLHGPTSSIVEVMGTIVFEARRPMSVAWMTPQGGFVKHLKKFERIRVTCSGEFAGYLGFTPKMLPDRNLEGMFPPVSQLRYLPLSINQKFDVKSTLNLSRQGFRFESQLKSDSHQGPSEPACQGLIQQTPSGQIIVLGPDGPVTGGYHKLGTIIRADWPYLASMTYFEQYELIPVNMDIARTAYDNTIAELQKRCKLLRIIQENGNSMGAYRKQA
jgi:allophanate hydrolase subunit 2